MIKLLDKTRTSLYNYFYIFCIMIYAGQATVFTRYLGDIRTVGNAFALFITLVFIIHNNIKFSKNYAYSLLVFLLYAAITSVNNGQVNPTWIVEWFIKLTIAYCICHGFGSRLFVVIETVLFHLCVIVLFFWVIHIMAPTAMFSIVKTFEFSSPYSETGNVYANMIFYTINKSIAGGNVSEYVLWGIRNAGFAWEPGAYGSIICLGIFCNILRTNLRLTKNIALLVFIISLLSTQSTTGGMTLILMVVFWLFANRKFGWGVVVFPLALGVYSLPFVGGKLSEELTGLEYLDYTTKSGGANFGRTYSLQLDFMEFLRHPILGLGGWTKGTWYAQHGYEFNTVSGIGELLSQYGAVMTLLFVYLLVKSCKYIKSIMETNNAFILIAVFIGVMISYNLWQQPLYIAFWLFGLYARRENLRTPSLQT